MLQKKQTGFTIVELLIVIVVIGILAAITVVAYNGVQKRANETKMKSDISTIVKAVQLARNAEQKVLKDITLSGYTASGCTAKEVGVDLAALPRTDECWTRYLAALDRISTAGGADVRNIVDPWGRPYMLDENEGESGGCNHDSIRAYAVPFDRTIAYPDSSVLIGRSGFTGCTPS